MTGIFELVLRLAVFVHLGLIGLSVWKVWKGENVIDRLIGVDLIGSLLTAILILIAVIQNMGIYLDIALGFTAVNFIGTVALARYAMDHRVY
ncbi:MAG: monovalent cation/H+ antiporter complex subunit F [Chloroflexota bacterium]